MADDYLWDPAGAPDPEVARLEAMLRPAAFAAVPLREQGVVAAPPRRHRIVRWAAIAAVLLMAAGGLRLSFWGTGAPWSISAERGAPVVRTARGVPTGGTLERGGLVETDARSSALLTVGKIGRARLEPGSRLRLLDDGDRQHRLSLERGTMHASIDAPPRYFLVQTGSALAVDLGCEYTLTTDERGNGVLTVEEGEVELQQGAVRTAVLAGNMAGLRAGSGPGLPYPVNASQALRRGVDAYDRAPSDPAALEAILTAADVRSTITLWHLLQRVAPAERDRVFRRLAGIAPPPASVTRERVLRGESGALQRWRTDLEPRWIDEPPFWRRAWLAVVR